MKIKLMFAAVMLVSCNIPQPKKYLVHFKNTLTHAATTRMEYQDPPRYVVGDTVELSSGFWGGDNPQPYRVEKIDTINE